MLRRAHTLGSIGFVLSMLVALEAAATAQRTFVASTGNDANPCSIAQPCRGFARAITQTVTGGEVIILDSAGYGTVTISQSVSIIAPPGVYAGVSVTSGQSGVTVNAPGATVVLRGLSINGLAGSIYGIRVISAARVRIEACAISSVGSYGIEQSASGAEVVVLDTVIRDNGNRGFSMVTDATAVFDNVRIEHNGGDGVYVAGDTTRASVTIRRSVLSHNAAAGAAIVNPNAPAKSFLVVEDSTIADNAGDGIFAGGTLDGDVEAYVRRDSIASNALSGISVFTPPSSGTVNVDAIENTFSNNAASHTKTRGGYVGIRLSRNDFGFGLMSDSNGNTFTYNDNTGSGVYVGLAPSSVPWF